MTVIARTNVNARTSSFLWVAVVADHRGTSPVHRPRAILIGGHLNQDSTGNEMSNRRTAKQSRVALSIAP